MNVVAVVEENTITEEGNKLTWCFKEASLIVWELMNKSDWMINVDSELIVVTVIQFERQIKESLKHKNDCGRKKWELWKDFHVFIPKTSAISSEICFLNIESISMGKSYSG